MKNISKIKNRKTENFRKSENENVFLDLNFQNSDFFDNYHDVLKSCAR